MIHELLLQDTNQITLNELEEIIMKKKREKWQNQTR